jgi:hypothetical protein
LADFVDLWVGRKGVRVGGKLELGIAGREMGDERRRRRGKN